MLSLNCKMFWFLLVLVITILGLLGHNFPCVGSSPHRILVDTDVDTDDIIALLYLLKLNKSEFDLVVSLSTLHFMYALLLTFFSWFSVFWNRGLHWVQMLGQTLDMEWIKCTIYCTWWVVMILPLVLEVKVWFLTMELFFPTLVVIFPSSIRFFFFPSVFNI